MLAFALLVACYQEPAAPRTQEQPLVNAEDLDRQIEDNLAQLTSSDAKFEVSAFMKVSYGSAKNVATGGTNLDINRLSIDDARVSLDTELAGWSLHFGLRGEKDSGNGFFGDAGTVGQARAFDVLLSRKLFDQLWGFEDGYARIGKFRPPFLGSALVEDNKLLFINRTFNGERWDFYDQGAQIESRLGPLRGWLSAQNGRADGPGDDIAYTLRGTWDIVGPGVGYDHEGAYQAPEGLAVTVGGAAFYETSSSAYSSQALEAHMTFERFAADAELVDNGNGLGDLYSWEATASFMITKDIEIATRYGSFDRADDTNMWRFGINKYISGHDVKLQANYAQSDSNAPRANVGVFQLGLVVSI